MKAKTTWQERLAALGLNQTEFGLLLGRDRVTAYRMLTGKPRVKGVPHVAKAMILALEMLAETDRAAPRKLLERSIAIAGPENQDSDNE